MGGKAKEMYSGETELYTILVKETDILRFKKHGCTKYGKAFDKILDNHKNKLGISPFLASGCRTLLFLTESRRDEFASDLTLAGIPHYCPEITAYALKRKTEGLEK